MTITIHRDYIQGSEEWHAARCGLLTGSQMKLIVTPTLKVADNDKSRAHLYELLAQRITRYTEPSYIGDDMLRGMEDEILARQVYQEHFAGVEQVGFVTNDMFGFTIGCSPDALVGDEGMLQIKSRRQKFQVETIISGAMPDEYNIQVQTELLVTRRAWCDFISYSGGLPMIPIRVYPDEKVQAAIVAAATAFEAALDEKMHAYRLALHVGKKTLIPTERRIEQEMHV